jgi:transcriptional regulator with XRE-family HTH domain
MATEGGWNTRRPNPVFSDEYQLLILLLTETRRAAGVSQRHLAARLGKAQSHVGMIERGQRRVDALEFHLIAEALGADPARLYDAFCRRLAAHHAKEAAAAA